jgi:hypothetical protein
LDIRKPYKYINTKEFDSISHKSIRASQNKMAAQEKDTQEIEKAKKLNHVPWGDEYEKMISGMLYV